MAPRVCDCLICSAAPVRRCSHRSPFPHTVLVELSAIRHWEWASVWRSHDWIWAASTRPVKAALTPRGLLGLLYVAMKVARPPQPATSNRGVAQVLLPEPAATGVRGPLISSPEPAMQATKEQLRKWMQERAKEKKPLPSPEEIRRQLGPVPPTKR